ncbi:MAG: hypothetical protein E6Q97_34100 [Desulfurellales bacterium]|nr:MAG: hypothetical protein E6Q97_34100 [Desulfurellales bacterium]
MEQVEGMTELRQKLTTLGPRVERKVCRRAINRGAAVIQKGIRAAAPVGKTRSIKKEIGKKVNAKKKGQITVKIGVGVGRKKKPKPKKTLLGRILGAFRKKSSSTDSASPHGHLVALGTQDRYTGTRTWKTRKGLKRSRQTGNKRAFRGRVAPDPFVKQGTAASQGAAASVIINTMKQGIEQEARKQQ